MTDALAYRADMSLSVQQIFAGNDVLLSATKGTHDGFCNAPDWLQSMFMRRCSYVARVGGYFIIEPTDFPLLLRRVSAQRQDSETKKEDRDRPDHMRSVD